MRKRNKFVYRKPGRYRKARVRQAILETGAADGEHFDLNDPKDAARFAKEAAKHARYVKSRAEGKRPGKKKKLTAQDRKLELTILRDTRALSKTIGEEAAIEIARKRFLAEGNRPLRYSTIQRKLGNRLDDPSTD